MPGFIQHGVGVHGGVGSPVGMTMAWVTGEDIGSFIVCTLEPLGSEIVTHDPRLQTLQVRVFNLVQAM